MSGLDSGLHSGGLPKSDKLKFGLGLSKLENRGSSLLGLANTSLSPELSELLILILGVNVYQSPILGDSSCADICPWLDPNQRSHNKITSIEVDNG